jgi:hypothetical protein
VLARLPAAGLSQRLSCPSPRIYLVRILPTIRECSNEAGSLGSTGSSIIGRTTQSANHGRRQRRGVAGRGARPPGRSVTPTGFVPGFYATVSNSGKNTNQVEAGRGARQSLGKPGGRKPRQHSGAFSWVPGLLASRADLLLFFLLPRRSRSVSLRLQLSATGVSWPSRAVASPRGSRMNQKKNRIKTGGVNRP